MRFFYADHMGKRFLGRSAEGAFCFVVLRDNGSNKVWSGDMHGTREAADADSQRAPGDFEGPVAGVVELLEVTAEVAEELGAAVSSNPDLFRDAHRKLMERINAKRTPGAGDDPAPRM